ncbi:hypothetical protein SuNHUV7_05950 (plasmid) [Pseudoseohaeicola sp. NH-UV-7]|uniref:sensor histidine kinase n=1 Tax=Sulfitobacter sp. TBRI5 TaxID=2989732 RepID=UPI003A60418F
MSEDHSQGQATPLNALAGAAPEEASGPARSLSVRVAILLTLALLPLGLLAVAQTQKAITAARQTYQASLQAQTSDIVRPEREMIIAAFGAANGLADAVAVLDPAATDCVALMQRAARSTPHTLFVGFTNSDGLSVCNNFDKRYDFSDNPSSKELFENPQERVSFNPSGEVTGVPVIIVIQPVYGKEQDFLGFVSLSFSGQPMVRERNRIDIAREATVVTFNAEGTILTSDVPKEEVSQLLPVDRSLAELVGLPRQAFTAPTVQGTKRDFALVPIIPGEAYALGVWKPETPLVQSVKYESATIMFPILMWITSLLVGLMAIQRQVIRPLRRLGRSMHDFADKRIAFRGDALNDSPAEIQQIAHTFHSVAFKLLHDEADLENRVFEREVLLKEVHHRVKNNLQLISSILNLQSRQATSKEARDALRTVQDRLSSLATVHRALYQTTELSNVRIDVLLESLFSQLLAIGSETMRGIKLTTDMDPVTLVPDQASPLAMLATEAFTNALKYSGKNRDGELFINVRLKQTDTADGADIILELANSVSEEVTDQGAVRLGRKLIRTFSQQLGGTAEQSLENGRYVFVVTFPFEAFQPEDENA